MNVYIIYDPWPVRPIGITFCSFHERIKVNEALSPEARRLRRAGRWSPGNYPPSLFPFRSLSTPARPPRRPRRRFAAFHR